jgi:hypothetical protein
VRVTPEFQKPCHRDTIFCNDHLMAPSHPDQQAGKMGLGFMNITEPVMP